jgi:hypothetical protein
MGVYARPSHSALGKESEMNNLIVVDGVYSHHTPFTTKANLDFVGEPIQDVTKRNRNQATSPHHEPALVKLDFLGELLQPNPHSHSQARPSEPIDTVMQLSPIASISKLGSSRTEAQTGKASTALY